MNNRFICIHGHFYQPPRENPWLEKIDYQESAAPYHDWNERISTECYRANGLSSILDHKGWVTRLSNNYSRISFNFGPTLLSWMEEHDKDAYEAVLEGDRISREKFGGHGSAIAQAYNHMIMPLANRRDKITQVKWGLRDFEKRFGRDAEAMWIPETAVDTETLEIMADHGLKYVILAPRQAQAVRPLGGDHLWDSVRGERIDIRQPYLINLPEGRSIAAFFYSGELSRAVAFEGLLNNGDIFSSRLCHGFDHLQRPQLVHIATDGESYGHHHLRGDMALAYTLDQLERYNLATLTNYGQYLELHPPAQEAILYEDSSWSCIHGIERWRANCGCNSGNHAGWTQAWRQPLRDAMNYLRDEIAPCYEDTMKEYTDSCWDMRDDYIRVILNRDEDNRLDFLKKWLRPGIDPAAHEVLIFKMLEVQRNLLLMYTSCAWFFDEISGVETVQTLAYAARAMELAGNICSPRVEEEFLQILQRAPSNIADFSNGRRIFDMLVLPSQMNFLKAGAHLAATALFQNRQAESKLACFDCEWKDIHRLYSGQAQLLIANIRITSRITREFQDIEFVVVHLGDHNINIGVLPASSKDSFEAMVREFTDTFAHGDLSKCLRLLDKYFENHIYYLNDLFSEQQKDVIDHILFQGLENLEEQFTQIYDRNYAVMSYLSRLHIKLPQVFSHIAHFVQNKHIQKQLRAPLTDFEVLERYIEEARNWDIDLDRKQTENLYVQHLKRILEQLRHHPDKDALLDLKRSLDLHDLFPFAIDLREIQNAFAQWLFRTGDDDPAFEELKEQVADKLQIHTNGGVNA